MLDPNRCDNLSPARKNALMTRTPEMPTPPFTQFAKSLVSASLGSSVEKVKSPLNEESEATSNQTDAKRRERAADFALVERIRSGDNKAFRILFEKYHRRAFAVAFGVVKNQQDAMDVVQDGFIKVHKHIGNFQGTSSFYTWLYRIIMNLSIDHVRRHKKRGIEFDDRIGREVADFKGDGALVPRILGSDPGKTVERRELLEQIQKALNELPEYHQTVIVLREVEGMSYEEMSNVLGVPRGTIMSRLFHARKKLQATLSQYMQGDLIIKDSRS